MLYWSNVEFVFFLLFICKMNTSLNVLADGLSETPLYWTQLVNVPKCKLCEMIPQPSWALGSCARCQSEGKNRYEQRYFSGRALGDFQMDDDTLLGSSNVYWPCNVPMSPGQYGASWQYYNNWCGGVKPCTL